MHTKNWIMEINANIYVYKHFVWSLGRGKKRWPLAMKGFKSWWMVVIGVLTKRC